MGRVLKRRSSGQVREIVRHSGASSNEFKHRSTLLSIFPDLSYHINWQGIGWLNIRHLVFWGLTIWGFGEN
jgi:hypothetical protein